MPFAILFMRNRRLTWHRDWPVHTACQQLVLRITCGQESEAICWNSRAIGPRFFQRGTVNVKTGGRVNFSIPWMSGWRPSFLQCWWHESILRCSFPPLIFRKEEMKAQRGYMSRSRDLNDVRSNFSPTLFFGSWLHISTKLYAALLLIKPSPWGWKFGCQHIPFFIFIIQF